MPRSGRNGLVNIVEHLLPCLLVALFQPLFVADEIRIALRGRCLAGDSVFFDLLLRESLALDESFQESALFRGVQLRDLPIRVAPLLVERLFDQDLIDVPVFDGASPFSTPPTSMTLSSSASGTSSIAAIVRTLRSVSRSWSF